MYLMQIWVLLNTFNRFGHFWIIGKLSDLGYVTPTHTHMIWWFFPWSFYVFLAYAAPSDRWHILGPKSKGIQKVLVTVQNEQPVFDAFEFPPLGTFLLFVA